MAVISLWTLNYPPPVKERGPDTNVRQKGVSLRFGTEQGLHEIAPSGAGGWQINAIGGASLLREG